MMKLCPLLRKLFNLQRCLLVLCTHIHICKHTCKQYTCKQHTCTHMHTHTCTHIHANPKMHTHMHTCTHTCTHTSIDTARTYMHTHRIHMHTHRIHMHAQRVINSIDSQKKFHPSLFTQNRLTTTHLCRLSTKTNFSWLVNTGPLIWRDAAHTISS